MRLFNSLKKVKDFILKDVFFLICFFPFLISAQDTSAITISILQGKEAIEPYLDDLASLTLENYASFPYLIQSTLEDEKEYLSEHLQSNASLVILAKDKEKVIGAITGHPFSEAPERFIIPFKEADILTDDIYYLGDILLKKEYRDQKIGRRMDEDFITSVLIHPEFKKIILCEVIRSNDDPRRPSDYFSLDEFWIRRGFVKHLELNCTLHWQEQGEDGESPKLMVFWLKEIH